MGPCWHVCLSWLFPLHNASVFQASQRLKFLLLSASVVQHREGLLCDRSLCHVDHCLSRLLLWCEIPVQLHRGAAGGCTVAPALSPSPPLAPGSLGTAMPPRYSSPCATGCDGEPTKGKAMAKKAMRLGVGHVLGLPIPRAGSPSLGSCSSSLTQLQMPGDGVLHVVAAAGKSTHHAGTLSIQAMNSHVHQPRSAGAHLTAEASTFHLPGPWQQQGLARGACPGLVIASSVPVNSDEEGKSTPRSSVKEKNQMPQGGLWYGSHLRCFPPLKTYVKLNTIAGHYSYLLLFNQCNWCVAEDCCWATKLVLLILIYTLV